MRAGDGTGDAVGDGEAVAGGVEVVTAVAVGVAVGCGVGVGVSVGGCVGEAEGLGVGVISPIGSKSSSQITSVTVTGWANVPQKVNEADSPGSMQASAQTSLIWWSLTCSALIKARQSSGIAEVWTPST